jgi:hypothetical protein
MRRALALFTIVTFGGFTTPAQAQTSGDAAPLSAIDWLSRSVEAPFVSPQAVVLQGDAANSGPAVSTGALAPTVTSSTLDGPSPDRIGLLPGTVTGLPRSLWSHSDQATLIDLMAAERVETLPALQDLMMTLLLAEADPPLNATPDGRLFVARIDHLLDMGALDPALSMLEAADVTTPELFRRWFDVSLLTGTEDKACRQMQEKPDIAPTLPARIFCLARAGEWETAALVLNTGRALGDINEETDILLSRFLDPDLYEGEAPLPPPSRPSPLVFRLREAIGERLATAPLPRAFANADLSDTAGWRNQIEAAERLARSGAVTENLLDSLYTRARPSASGGIWDRAAAYQAFDTAITGGNPDDIGDALITLWPLIETARIEVPIARLYAADLAGVQLGEAAQVISYHMQLLSPLYEAAAQSYDGNDRADLFLKAVAQGDLSEQTPQGPYESAVMRGFTNAGPSRTLAYLTAQGQLGEALLRSIALFTEGLSSDPNAVSDALALFRSVGMEDIARRAALQYLLLDRRA